MSEVTPLFALTYARDPAAFVDGFLDFAAKRDLVLYPAQEEALLAIADDKNVILGTPTGSGKTLVATAQHVRSLELGQRSFYTCPIKALVSEKFFQLCRDFGGEHVGMMTGDAAINAEAPIICCTAEVLASMALRQGDRMPPCSVIADEFHYYADRERGAAWQIPLLTLPHATFLLMSATLGDPSFFAEELTTLTGKETVVIDRGERPVPLDFSYRETALHETISNLVRDDRAPIYLVNFTQRDAAEQAQNLMSLNFSSKEDKQAIAAALSGFRFDTPYGKEMQRFVRHGVGVHHAGLLPKYRLMVERLAQKGLLKVISGTDTLGVGVNIPIRSVLFTQLNKFDGEKSAILSVRDFMQIAGRAGRRGFDTRGDVVVQAPEHVIENLKLEAKAQAGKKVVKRKPPERGYVHWDKSTFERLLSGKPEPLKAQLELNHGMLLQALQDAAGPAHGYRRLLGIIAASHADAYRKRELKRTAAELFRSLRTAGVIHLKPLRVSTELQNDFSMMHALSLWLLGAIKELPEADPQAHALTMLTLCESIVENPAVILRKQEDKLKTLRINELKAEGVPYDERIAALEEITYLKPHADWIYASFNEFAKHHPWLGGDSRSGGAHNHNIRPKSIARDMFETYASFNDYVREYGLQRSEGALLRYLSEVCKVLLHTVPQEARTSELEDISVYFETMLRQVDRSLLEAWEKLTSAPEPEAVTRAPPKVDDSPALIRNMRSLVHRFMRTVTLAQWDDAAEQLSGERTGDDMKALIAPLGLVFERQPAMLHISVEPEFVHATQTLSDAEGSTGDCLIFSARRQLLADAAPACLELVGLDASGAAP